MRRFWPIALLAVLLFAVVSVGAQEMRETKPPDWELKPVETEDTPITNSVPEPGPEPEPGPKAGARSVAEAPGVDDRSLDGLHKLYEGEGEPADGTQAANAASTLDESFGGFWGILQVIAVLCLLCGFIILLGYAAKRFGGRTPLLAGQRLGTVLGKVYLSPRASLHYVASGGRILVIGLTANDIRLLTEFNADDFESALADDADELEEAAAPASFLAQLRKGAEQLKRPSTEGIEDDLSSLRGEIRQLQEHLEGGRSEPID